MASGVYDYFKKAVMQGSYNLAKTGAGSVWVALVNNSYVAAFSPSSHDYFGLFQGTYQISGLAASNYSSGGLVLSSPALAESDANLTGVFTGSNMLWASSSITARGAVLYQSSGLGFFSDPCIAFVDFGADYSSSAGNFQITWAANGIMYLT